MAPDAAARIAAAAAGRAVGFLLYIAGGDGNFQNFIDRDLAGMDRLLALNVTTPTHLVKTFAPAMAARGKGGVMLCSSVAGLAGRATGTLYSATKAYLNVLCEGLWLELGQKGVDVLAAILPTVNTPALQRMGMDFSKNGAAEPADIADEILAAMGKGPALHAGGVEKFAMQLRSLPRDQAVRMISGG